MKKIFYLLGDSYSHSIEGLVKDLLSVSEFFSSNCFMDFKSGMHSFDALCFTPMARGGENKFVSYAIKKKIDIILVLDDCHQYYKDYLKYKRCTFSAVITSFKTGLTTKNEMIIESLYARFIKSRVVLNSNINEEAFFFCSQPLLEDKRDGTFTQYDLLVTLLIKAKNEKCQVYYKRHPREVSDIPSAIVNDQHLIIYEGDEYEALSSFKNWFGHSSNLLFAAKALGHNVVFLKEELK